LKDQRVESFLRARGTALIVGHNEFKWSAEHAPGGVDLCDCKFGGLDNRGRHNRIGAAETDRHANLDGFSSSGRGQGRAGRSRQRHGRMRKRFVMATPS
jgi:hypothetical protein